MPRGRVAIVFPADAKERLSTNLEQSRFAGIAKALRATGMEVVGAPFADELVEAVRAQLLGVDGVLVWINPIQAGRDRSVLNAMLADVASMGVFVSAHPEVIDKLGTKEVLYRTREMSWGCDTRLYATLEAMRTELPISVGFGARVLKQLVNALYPAAPGTPSNEAPRPGPRHYFPSSRPDFQRLKQKLEHQWLDELCRLVGLEKSQLPVIWDADFLYGPKDADGADTFVLCEINVSSVYPFPEDALLPLATETLAKIKADC